MKSNPDTPELIQQLIDEIDLTITINSIVDNADGTYTLATCHTKHLQVGYEIEIDEATYLITEIENNESITVSGDVLPTADSFEAYEIKFFHGTIKATNAEITQIQFAEEKFPMIYLLEIMRERLHDNFDDEIEKESECRLFFLTQCNFADWITEDHYTYAINPMRNLVFMFKDAVMNSTLTGELTGTSELINHANFGKYITDSGHEKQLFNDNTSGCELNITIPFVKNSACSCD